MSKRARRRYVPIQQSTASAAFVKCSNKKEQPLEATYATSALFFLSLLNERSTSRLRPHNKERRRPRPPRRYRHPAPESQIRVGRVLESTAGLQCFGPKLRPGGGPAAGLGSRGASLQSARGRSEQSPDDQGESRAEN